MSMEVNGGYKYYDLKQPAGPKMNTAEAEELKPETPEAQTNNRDVMIFGTSPYAKDNFSGYIRQRIEEVAARLPEMAKNAERQEQLTFSEWYGKSVTISDEAKQIMSGISERKEAQRAATEALRTLEPENPFLSNGVKRQQYLVFTEELYNNGFYTDLCDEDIQRVQGILQDITAGMDKISGSGFVNFDPKAEMSHEAARLELISSVNALRHFSENFVPEEMRESFNSLIDRYESYNGAKVAAHKNIYDMRDEAMKDLPTPTAANASVRKYNEESAASAAIGRVTHTAEQVKANADEYQKLFDALRKNPDGRDGIFGSLQKTLADYASGGSKNSAVLHLLNARNSSAVLNMSDYWGKLLGFAFTPEPEE